MLLAYLPLAVPAVIAGRLVSPLGLVRTVLGHGAVIIVASVAGLLAQARWVTPEASDRSV